jgi:hypothetical protein
MSDLRKCARHPLPPGFVIYCPCVDAYLPFTASGETAHPEHRVIEIQNRPYTTV